MFQRMGLQTFALATLTVLFAWSAWKTATHLEYLNLELEHVKRDLELVSNKESENEENMKLAITEEEKLKMADIEPNGQCIDLKTIAAGIKSYVRDYSEPINIPHAVRSYFVYFQPELDLINTLDQDNPMLVEHIKQHLWITPSPRSVPYNLKFPDKKDRSEGQLEPFLDIFKNRSGYFIECGGLDGEDISNTLDLEMRYNWTGVLIEASPVNFETMASKKRKAAMIPACLSLERRPTSVTFSQDTALGRIVNDTKSGVIKEVKVHCVPFYSIYKTIEREEIDLFVLDIEGHEVEVLHTIPWDKINIHVFMIEYAHGKFSKEYMKEYMLKQNYRLYSGSKQRYWPGYNFLFIKKGSKYDEDHP